MDNNEIKKSLLKNKNIAEFKFIRKGNAYYTTECFHEGKAVGEIIFEIPVTDMGDADFGPTLPGQLLLRWIYSYTKY